MQSEMDVSYKISSVKGSVAASSFHASTKVALADKPPSVREADVYIVYWVDLGKTLRPNCACRWAGPECSQQLPNFRAVNVPSALFTLMHAMCPRM